MQRIIIFSIVTVVVSVIGLMAMDRADEASAQEDAPMPRTGGCFCGHIRYEIIGHPRNQTVCHCPGCKKSSGAGALPWLTVKTADFKLTQGELARVSSQNYPKASCDGCDASGAGSTRTFCPKCGSPISFEGAGRADREIDVTLGSLDDPTIFAPKAWPWRT